MLGQLLVMLRLESPALNCGRLENAPLVRAGRGVLLTPWAPTLVDYSTIPEIREDIFNSH